MSDLTPKQQRFVREYLIDLNATQAAIRAGYSANGADTAGPRLLENPDVKAAVDCGKLQRSERTEITSDRVLKEIAGMAFYDPADLLLAIEATGDDILANVEIVGGKSITGLRSASDIRLLPEDVRRAIVGWGYDRNQNFTIKLADKSKALDQLARHLSLYSDKLDVGFTDKFIERLERAESGGDEYDFQRRERIRSEILTEIAVGELSLPVPALAPPPVPAVAVEPVEAAPAPPAPKPPAPKPAPYRPVVPWPDAPAVSAIDYDPLKI